MRREDCKVGMIVTVGEASVRGVVLKVNPKFAVLKMMDTHRGHLPGSKWKYRYEWLSPLVSAGDEVSNEMMMRSFQDPDNEGVKAWSSAQKKRGSVPTDGPPEDDLIVRAILEIYSRLEDLNGKARYDLSHKINLLFRAVGHEFTREEAEKFLEGTRADAS